VKRLFLPSGLGFVLLPTFSILRTQGDTVVNGIEKVENDTNSLNDRIRRLVVGNTSNGNSRIKPDNKTAKPGGT
jgi:hypothetical protein